MLVQKLKAHISELRKDIKATEDQINIYRHIRIGSIVHADSLHIYVARNGVGEWLSSYKPAILKYKDWAYCDEGFALEFDVIASNDPVPYSSPYQSEYSGKLAQIRGPKYYVAKKIKIVPLSDLPIYIGYYHKTALFEKLLKGVS